MDLLIQAVDALLARDEVLLGKLHDHSLKGQWQGYRELHPARLSTGAKQLDGWILIYKFSNDRLVLVLVAMGDHQILIK